MPKPNKKTAAKRRRPNIWNSHGQRIVDPPDPDYLQALGEFIETFAETEAWLFQLYAHVSRIPISRLRVLCGGKRVDDISKDIKRFWKTNPKLHPEREDLGRVLTQLGKIKDVRNSVVHYASETTKDGRRISSAIQRKADLERLQEYTVSPEILSQMTEDLHLMIFHIQAVLFIPKFSAAERLKAFPTIAQYTWHYKGEPNRGR